MKVITFINPFNFRANLYQRYYIKSLKQALNNNFFVFNFKTKYKILNFFSSLCDDFWNHSLKADALLKKVFCKDQYYFFSYLPTGIMPYLFLADYSDKKILRVIIDSTDSGNIALNNLLNWVDLYFKTNFWPKFRYSNKIIPFFNLNPIVLNNIKKLICLRNINKKYDLCFIVRVWGGRNEIEGIEHCLKLLEEISKIKCKKFIYAYLVAGNIEKTSKRLDKQKILWSIHPFPLNKLWIISAQSRLNIIRLGMHYCIPWRLTDILAMGGCPLLDREPFTVWPEPLIKNKNYLSLDLSIGPEKPVALEEEYKTIKEKIENFLLCSDLIKKISKNNSKYFDNYLYPFKVGYYMIKTIKRRLLDV